ncbi:MULTISPECIES: hypothetical protein [unclassified Mesorhizobium]|uniref:hypothetical protein n=1 Tax=unclassified Mesorhizobium TaxID=325217 RepID=UPI00333A8D16
MKDIANDKTRCDLRSGISSRLQHWRLGIRRKPASPQAQPERYVPANGDIIEFLFGGPRYYDNHLFTTAAEPCSYNRVGPDANAANVINDHYCGK